MSMWNAGSRRWLVNYWRNGKVVKSGKISAPTKFQALLNAREFMGWQSPGERVTVSLMKEVK